MSKIGRHVNAVDKEKLAEIRRQPNLPNAEERYKAQQAAMHKASRSVFSSREEAPLFQSNSLANAYGEIEEQANMTIDQIEGALGDALAKERLDSSLEVIKGNASVLLSMAYAYNDEKRAEEETEVQMGNNQN